MSFRLLEPDKGILLSDAISTNTILKGKEFPPGTWILADFQSQGRGRKNRAWAILGDEPFVFSGKFRSTGELPSPNLFSLFIGVSVAKALLSTYPSLHQSGDLKIKWPNDIFVNGKKVCGILIETEKEGEDWDWIVGIGINLFGKSFSEELPEAGFVTSLETESGRRNRFLETLLPLLNDATLSLADGKTYLSFINERLLWKENTIAYTENGVPQTAILLGVDDSGRLLVRSPSGEITEFIDSPEDFRSLG
ncbi:biotin-(acetyl-CoA-carboxylase) ligase [Leptospira fainei serovar Hurstbridge str. BUT 6]|uniref:Biotin-(Acetyl-CoA-carboxylase) ligase n=1 Tax=Leptospira fainei serovar Hurstbridge str. BUT 6 TaxID=1193011 RepID=S3W1Y0_9LEPT|nr:biotin--[acetyl-CoA-carboxylase] ligase [Leptospira fainei]EPG74302.1 biotin-(acetyl-CoA-carboxylase) ligase [Leptospira fainei serovar Hurstbridge str. BUT 6]